MKRSCLFPSVLKLTSIMEVINIFLVILYNIVTIVDSTCTRNNKNCCVPGIRNNDSNACAECKIGFFGEDCSNPCRYPNYGEKCQKECNCAKDFCDKAEGCRNRSDCKVGYYGSTCSNPCRFPSYGERCQSLCNCSEIACNHISGCQSGTEIPLTFLKTKIIEWNTTTQRLDKSSPEIFKTSIIIGGSIILTLILIFVSVIIALVRKHKRSERREEPDSNIDSEFSSFHSFQEDLVEGTCTTSARYFQDFQINRKSLDCYRLEIYENTRIIK